MQNSKTEFFVLKLAEGFGIHLKNLCIQYTFRAHPAEVYFDGHAVSGRFDRFNSSSVYLNPNRKGDLAHDAIKREIV
jgi:hypothetical protein